MKKNLWLIITAIAFFSFLVVRYEIVQLIPGKTNFLATDMLQNVYTVRGSNLIKYDARGQIMQTYSNLNYGFIHSVDASDPLRVLVFYKEFSVIQYLDNQLTPAGNPINLQEIGLGMCSAACASEGNHFWVYDPMRVRLYRISNQLRVSIESPDLELALGFKPQPSYMQEESNLLYLLDFTNGILVFDRYGSPYRSLPVNFITDFQVIQNKVFYLKNDSVFQWSIGQTPEYFPLPENNKKRFRMSGNMLFLTDGEKTTIYRRVS